MTEIELSDVVEAEIVEASTEVAQPLRFWTYRQNNSGGWFHEDASIGIGRDVIVQATSPEDADQRACAIGIYFDGVADDRDCDCCGDRWYQAFGDGWTDPNDDDQGYGRRAAWVHLVDGQKLHLDVDAVEQFALPSSAE